MEQLQVRLKKSIASKIKYDLHVAKNVRIKYQFDESLFSVQGNVLIANFYQARLLAQKINSKREEEKIFDAYVTPGQLNAAGLLHEIFHFVIRHYEEKENPGVFERSIFYLKNSLGGDEVEKVLRKFVELFPPVAVQKGITPQVQYLSGSTNGKPNREIILEEIILLHLENLNPAFQNLKELFDDKHIAEGSPYKNFLSTTEKFFEQEKPLSIENLSLLSALRKPILSNLTNLEAQLDYIREKWKVIIDEKLLEKILGGEDLIREDVKLFIQHGGVGTPPVPDYQLLMTDDELEKIRKEYEQQKGSLEDTSLSYHFEPEQFTQDIDWMPRVVMLAKNIFVWLDQLSKKYQRDIFRLDQIPDEELDRLASWNINALWLIGIWERSAASKKIKQFCGNPEAAPSAYSLYDYVIANQLGGEQAFENFKHRCTQRHIRLSSDMVPNHTGIFSKWILERPDYFIQASNSPYPSYTFTGPDLSDDSHYQIRIEDKYYAKTDAAVVFQLIDNWSGQIRYIYHGNDGTNMPWNDTAQLNLLLPEVRESLIQTIMHVARKTPIIRFDAAMTLAKKHFSRLWYPQPGHGGAIPSRSDYAMSHEAFNRVFSEEFWREVVDRINYEMPHTLLLAEAFWLMEGYFVRSLGMHRVYNSAFMHMFMKEENDKYRDLITNTLEFNPEILKRYVNFMSNPDEETAVNQFGKGDKYFGVAVMMITLPGLPMFAHGQVEGFTEKYGMEYYRAYYSEFVDENLVRRHEEEIFPLLEKRYLFSQVSNFEFYDFLDESGNVNENVFAFSNMKGNERTLVFYNNSYEQAKGKIHFSTGKVSSEANTDLRSKSLTEALDLNVFGDIYFVLKDHKTKIEFLRNGKELMEEGISVFLNGYQYHVFLGFTEVKDETGEYHELHKLLNGNGVQSITQALKELKLFPLHEAVINLCNRELLKEFSIVCGFIEQSKLKAGSKNLEKVTSYGRTKILNLVNEVKTYLFMPINEQNIVHTIEQKFFILSTLDLFVSSLKKKEVQESLKHALVFYNGNSAYKDFFILYTIILTILEAVKSSHENDELLHLYNELVLDKPLWQGLLHLSDTFETIKQEFGLAKILPSEENIFPDELLAIVNSKSSRRNTTLKGKAAGKKSDFLKLVKLLNKDFVKKFLSVNEYQGKVYFSKENLEIFLHWSFTFTLVTCTETYLQEELQKSGGTQKEISAYLLEPFYTNHVSEMLNFIEKVKTLSDASGYDYTLFLASLGKKSK
ncbi:MAG: alpha-amylase family glycosyl hydrolase [Ignavibacteriaceae bacterium]|nr:alpha-amylase family glycosyl hydrolase [Ignavibacteriaceae bacterium]